ncbi:cell division protein SepF [Planotetraspora sp. A-T 1434]|uniref:cell division protein SepF n=1 Tax=Planotetraspora sp. A-T 1434 TaxID=2979219 RepID=UPI0021C00B9C|nr:cell division protein SepF [Planotetraspora sp. A-T 1434]MCT9930648.1 cell division protein SepF [Planotetraspora sp. A-T 1434]
MAGAMRKMAVYLGLVEDDRYDDRYGTEYGGDEDYGDDDYESPRRGFVVGPSGAPAAGAAHVAAHERDEDGETAVPAPRPPTTVLERRTTDLARITTLHPRTYNEARTIGEHFREGTPVIMNLTEMVDSDAKRLVDFAAGLVFGLHGSIERVTNKVFLLSPANVEVTAEDKARIAERGFFNQS